MIITKLRNKILNKIVDVNIQIYKILGKKLSYGIHGGIDADDFIDKGWIEFYLKEMPTKIEEQKIKKLLRKHFGKLDRPRFSQHFKNLRDKDGDLRWNNVSFFSYLMVKIPNQIELTNIISKNCQR